MNHQSVLEMLGRAAQRFPEKIAIEAAERRISYGRLAEETNRLANYLISSGLAKGSIVAILAGHPLDVITSIIAVLKAGGVFVPFDPNLPVQRLRAMWEEVSPLWLLSESGLFEKAVEIAGGQAATTTTQVIHLDGGNINASRSTHNLIHAEGYAAYHETGEPLVQLEPDDMAYVYFTSGSTGRPKGIAGRRKGIDHFIGWEIKTFGVDEHARISQFTSPSFDAFLRDALTPLCAGATVCVPPGRETLLNPRKLIEWMDGQRITLIHCVPSLFRALVNEELKPDFFASLKYILMAGEPLLPSDVKRWMDVYGERVQLVNLYGPTETTMTKFVYFVKASDTEQRSISIGKPMEGARALVVDEKGQACPPGKVGEIYIRTPYRTLGYYKRPAQTAEVFIPNPFNNDPRDLVYKTGDLSRILEDGNFEFLGRKDQQVKIRGTRVELGEIENLLRRHERVRDVAVVDRDDTSGNKFLCAYVVLTEQTETSVLREYLSDFLPESMLPSVIVSLDALPRTMTGKVDRRALPAPGLSPGNEKTYVAPRTPLEETLARIWAQLLNRERVGIQDNFFELGGHSLLATQFLSRVRDACHVELPLRSLFSTPTIAGLSLAITQLQIEREEEESELRSMIEEIKDLPEEMIEELLSRESK